MDHRIGQESEPVQPNRQERRHKAMTFKKLANAQRSQIRRLNEQLRLEGWGEWQQKDLQGEQAEAIKKLQGNSISPEQFWFNNRYSVQVFRKFTAWGEILHLLVREHNASADVPWRDLQRIKDDLVEPERTAVQVFPARADLVDQANLYHLWVLPQAMTLPFGLHLKDWGQSEAAAP